MEDQQKSIQSLGRIDQWPDGYAMTLGWHEFGRGVVRCCSGHDTPEAARTHGLVRLGEVAGRVADRDVSAWRAEGAA